MPLARIIPPYLQQQHSHDNLVSNNTSTQRDAVETLPDRYTRNQLGTTTSTFDVRYAQLYPYRPSTVPSPSLPSPSIPSVVSLPVYESVTKQVAVLKHRTVVHPVTVWREEARPPLPPQRQGSFIQSQESLERGKIQMTDHPSSTSNEDNSQHRIRPSIYTKAAFNSIHTPTDIGPAGTGSVNAATLIPTAPDSTVMPASPSVLLSPYNPVLVNGYVTRRHAAARAEQIPLILATDSLPPPPFKTASYSLHPIAKDSKSKQHLLLAV